MGMNKKLAFPLTALGVATTLAAVSASALPTTHSPLPTIKSPIEVTDAKVHVVPIVSKRAHEAPPQMLWLQAKTVVRHRVDDGLALRATVRCSIDHRARNDIVVSTTRFDRLQPDQRLKMNLWAFDDQPLREAPRRCQIRFDLQLQARPRLASHVATYCYTADVTRRGQCVKKKPKPKKQPDDNKPMAQHAF